MTVSLYISGELMESIEVSFEHCRCCEEKASKVKGYSDWLKYKYKESIIIYPDWYIIAEQQSKMNER